MVAPMRLCPLLALVCTLAGAASALASEPPPFVVDAERDRAHVPFALKELDPGATLGEVRGSQGWAIPEEKAANVGPSNDARWLRFAIETPLDDLTPYYVLTLSWPLVDEATLYAVGPAGESSSVEGARLSAVEDRDFLYRQPAFRIDLPPGATQEYLLRVRSRTSTLLPLEIFTPEGFAAKRRNENLLIGAFFGVLVLITLSGALAFAFLREVAFLWYALMVGFFGLWQASTFGLPDTYVWPGNAFILHRALHLFGIGFGASMVVFTRMYLETPTRHPQMHRLMFPAGVYAISALGLWTLLAPGPALIFAVVAITVVAALWCIVVSFLSFRQGYRPAYYYMAAWLVGCVAAMSQALRAVGWLPSNIFNDFGLQISVLFTFATLWLGMIDRLVGMRTDLERSVEDIRRLEREDAAKRTFLATASHDLRQPLHAVGLLLGALREDLKTPRSIDLVEKVQSATTEMGDMFNALLDISRLDAGLVETRPTAVDLDETLSRLGDEFGVQARNKGLRFEWEPCEATVRSDPVLLGRILRNLLTNALRYTDEGEIRLSSAVTDHEVAIAVSDTGRGIPAEAREEVFEPFHRLGPETDAGEALGLGLAIVHRLAGLLGHRVTVESGDGAGTTFTLHLERTTPIARTSGLEPGRAPRRNDERVLVVDDDAAVRTGMQAQLESWGYAVRTAGSLADAETAIESWKPDVVFADYRLGPDENGVDVIERIRERLGSTVPAFIVSGDTSAELADAVRAHGLRRLTKPVQPSRLRMALDYASRQGE